MSSTPLTPNTLERLLAPYLAPQRELTESKLRLEERPRLFSQLERYLELLLRWNQKTNLTAVRDPEAIITRHFGESLFAACTLAPHLAPGDTVLDFGSGAGFPGIPLQLLLPEVHVTLGESQHKKAAFLREALRTLDLQQTAVHGGRIEDLPQGITFQAVTLRAVDDPALAEQLATKRVAPGGYLLSLHGGEGGQDSKIIPESRNRFVTLKRL
ncbi:MAG: 16S rRNA (guanine(527)-N(7))-methyltransferase RsmG [Acidobacteriaceae bacterium]|nr:16S rRNA (guanine(527)-N(7))-methyltransferase RsmG [Acidobacteriaceae bacterium]